MQLTGKQRELCVKPSTRRILQALAHAGSAGLPGKDIVNHHALALLFDEEFVAPGDDHRWVLSETGQLAWNVYEESQQVDEENAHFTTTEQVTAIPQLDETEREKGKKKGKKKEKKKKERQRKDRVQTDIVDPTLLAPIAVGIRGSIAAPFELPSYRPAEALTSEITIIPLPAQSPRWIAAQTIVDVYTKDMPATLPPGERELDLVAQALDTAVDDFIARQRRDTTTDIATVDIATVDTVEIVELAEPVQPPVETKRWWKRGKRLEAEQAAVTEPVADVQPDQTGIDESPGERVDVLANLQATADTLAAIANTLQELQELNRRHRQQAEERIQARVTAALRRIDESEALLDAQAVPQQLVSPMQLSIALQDIMLSLRNQREREALLERWQQADAPDKAIMSTQLVQLQTYGLADASFALTEKGVDWAERISTMHDHA